MHQSFRTGVLNLFNLPNPKSNIEEKLYPLPPFNMSIYQTFKYNLGVPTPQELLANPLGLAYPRMRIANVEDALFTTS